ncbi:MAG: hypothetical protein FWH18_12680 [Marinilabiliaceae bacterium]|nr:hypothetical protein [Marinilabiliaceae bacterium]
MKKIIIFAFLISLNAFSQTKGNKSYSSTLCDSIKSIVWSDIERYAVQFEQLEPYFDNSVVDTYNVTYFRETVKISFNSDEYSEIATTYSNEGDDIKENFKKMKTVQKLKQIEAAMVKDNRILFDLFECFIYQFTIRYEETPGLEIEYRIKADEYGMRIISRSIYLVLVSDHH